MGAENAVSPRLVQLYERALACQTFAAYKLHELKGTPARELKQALQLLALAQQAKEAHSR